MKISLSIRPAFLAATAIFAAAGVHPAAAAQPCTGPFRQCAIEVQAYCSRDSNGQQRMTYWDFAGYTMRFEQCVGRIFEASGRPNPYKTGVSSYRGMTVPYSEVLYPMERSFR